MLSKKIVDRVNLQINREIYSAYLYMAMSAKAAEAGYQGVASWLMVQYHEEMFHAMKFYYYLLDQGARPELAKIDAPETKGSTIKEWFTHVLEHEKFVTASIRELLELALAEKDYASENLLRWYVDEQVEEEKNATEILQQLELLGDGKQGAFLLNIELGKRALTVQSDFSGGIVPTAAG